MDRHIEELYRQAPRFDTGTQYQDPEYIRRLEITFRMEDLGEKMFGFMLRNFLEEYVGKLYEANQFELMHFFEQGYLAAKREMTG